MGERLTAEVVKTQNVKNKALKLAKKKTLFIKFALMVFPMGKTGIKKPLREQRRGSLKIILSANITRLTILSYSYPFFFCWLTLIIVAFCRTAKDY